MATAIPTPYMAMASTAGALVLAICARPRAAHGCTLQTTYAHWFRPAPNPNEHPPNENDAQASGPQLHINTTISFADKLAAYRGRADSLGPTPM
ncbi:hypothetical protein DFH06DRAFT_1194794, partial [Mycena polygramma]